MKNREELIKIYNQVILDIKNGYYENSLGEEIEFPGKSKIKKDSKMYKSLPPCTDHPKFSSTKFKQNAYACFRKVMFAILKEDPSIFRPFVTDKLYDILYAQKAVTR